jgi:uncharacterized LabA/DUF88 family protein
VSRKRATVYIDGFNLYNGVACARRLDCRWVNLHKYFQANQLAHYDIVSIKFFTALVIGSTQANQITYLNALRTLPNLEVIEGVFQSKEISCKFAGCGWRGQRPKFDHPTEKKTDVAIASRIFEDAINGATDTVVLVSGDSDFVPAIEGVRRCFPNIETIAIVPTLGRRFEFLSGLAENRPPKKSPYAAELRAAVHRHQDINPNAFLRSQFDTQIQGTNGRVLEMPKAWVQQDNRAFSRLIDRMEDAVRHHPRYRKG